MRLSKLTQIYVLLFLVMSVFALTSQRTVLYSGQVSRESGMGVNFTVRAGETIRMQVSGGDVKLSMYSNSGYNGNSYTNLTLADGESVDLYFSHSDYLVLSPLSPTPVHLTVTSVGIPGNAKGGWVVVTSALLFALVIESVVWRRKPSFPLIADEIRGIPLIGYPLVLVLLWNILHAKVGGGYGPIPPLENEQVRIYTEFIGWASYFILLFMLLLPLLRTVFPEDRMMYKTYPIDPVRGYLAKVLVYLAIYLPFAGIILFHILFGPRSSTATLEDFGIRYLYPVIISTLATFTYLLISILVEDVFRRGSMTMTLPPVLFILSLSGTLGFYPFNLIRTAYPPEQTYQSLFLPRMIELTLVAILFLLLIVSVNIMYRKSSRFTE